MKSIVQSQEQHNKRQQQQRLECMIFVDAVEKRDDLVWTWCDGEYKILGIWNLVRPVLDEFTGRIWNVIVFKVPVEQSFCYRHVTSHFTVFCTFWCRSGLSMNWLLRMLITHYTLSDVLLNWCGVAALLFMHRSVILTTIRNTLKIVLLLLYEYRQKKKE